MLDESWDRTSRRARAALAAGALLLAACGGGEPDGAASDGRPLVLAYKADLQTLNPVTSTDQVANEVIRSLVFTPLVTFDATFEARPWLAESWTLTDSSVVFRLRDDVRWHDGEPVTAGDVAFTFQLAKDPDAASPLAAAYLGSVESATVLGPHEIRFTFTHPHAQPLQDFYWPPVPRHVLEGVAPAELSRHPFGRDPVGSGPYRLESWEAGSTLRFRAVEAFPEELGGPPAIREVVYRVLPEATTRLRELMRGTVHLDGPLTPADASEVRSAEGVDLAAFPWRLFTYIGWNGRDPRFAEPSVRRAMTLALDRPELLEAALYGHGQVATGPIPPWHPYAPDLEPLPHDRDSARALLDAAGWRDRDGDGVREREGREMRFRLMTGQANPVHADLVQMIQAQLGEVGVAAEPLLLEWQTVLGRHRSREFEAVLTNWVLDNFRVDPRPLFHSRQVEVEGSANRSSYGDPVADRLMEEGARTTDPERAARTWAEFAEVIQADQPFTFLFWNDELAGVSRQLEGVEMDARGELHGVATWRWRDGPGSSP
jgi:peptide/nickel transport system substrate-binding protein